MRIVSNPWFGSGLPDIWCGAPKVSPSVAADKVSALLEQCPVAKVTPLIDASMLADRCKVGKVYVKDESTRMGLGSFKALGAAYVIANDAKMAAEQGTTLAGRVYVTASAGNHGLSVAAGSGVFGASAVVYLSESVPVTFTERLEDLGARVVRIGTTYEESMSAAKAAAAENGWTLLSDTSWHGYTEIPHRLMEGYLQCIAEAVDQVEQVPTHMFLQAGVGGMACAFAAYARKVWGDGFRIVIVEPELAPALINSIDSGKLLESGVGISSMGRLDCKEPSLIALDALAEQANVFVCISETEVADAVSVLSDLGLSTTPSGGAGLAAMLVSMDVDGAREELGLSDDSVVLAFLSETAC